MPNEPELIALLARDPGDYLSASPPQPRAVMSPTHAEIAKRAYEKYESRGRQDGFQVDDWLAACDELSGETFGHSSCPSLSPTQFPEVGR